MRKSLSNVASSPKWLVSLVLVIGVMILMGQGVIGAEIGLTFLGGQATGLGLGGMK